MDWSEPELFAAFSPNCLSCLRSISLKDARLSAESIAAVASAAPQLRQCSLDLVQPTCHPAIVLATLWLLRAHRGDPRQ